MSLYSQRPRPKHTGLTLDLLSRGNSDQNELREVVAGAVSNQRVENFRFRDSFEARWTLPTPCLSPPGVGQTRRLCARGPPTGSVTCSAVTGRRTVPGCRARKSPGTKLKEGFSLPVQDILTFYVWLFPSTLELVENTKSRLCFWDDNDNYCGTNDYHDNHCCHYDYNSERSVSQSRFIFICF